MNLILYNNNKVKCNLGQVGFKYVFIKGEKFYVGDKIEYSRVGESTNYSTVIIQNSNGIYPLGNINVIERSEGYIITKHQYLPIYNSGDILLTNAPNNIKNTVMVIGD